VTVFAPILTKALDRSAYAVKALDALSVFTKSLIARGGATLGRAESLAILQDLARLPPAQRFAILRTLPAPMVRALDYEWWWQAHGGQAEPPKFPDGSDWRIWAIVAGRGFGKTRAGAEWVWARAREEMGTRTFSRKGTCPPSRIRIALVAATIEEVERVMIHGESGLLAAARGHERPRWRPSRGILTFPSGAQAHAFSAARPEKLRGPQHHYAWCDELAKWPHAEETWNNLMLGLRLGEHPRTLVTTTPKPVPLLRTILALPRCATTRGRTDDNPHLPADFVAAMRDMFAGTRLARQELEGQLLENYEGALWTRAMLEKARGTPSPCRGEGRLAEGERGEGKPVPVTPSPSHSVRERAPPSPLQGEGSSGARGTRSFVRIVVGLDPPASTGGDACGIVVCGKDEDGIAWVLADLSARGLSPEAWATRVAEAAGEWGHLYTGVPAKVVAEKNQGGDMIASVLRAVDANLRVRLVPATKSKAARAEPIALRFQTARARLAGTFPDLEDQLCALTWSGYQLPGSPDRLDAMVWAMTELFEKRPEPRLTFL
jgi:phage terminase large subunit-like protein